MVEALPLALTIAVASVAAGLGAVCRLLLDGLVTTLATRRAFVRSERALPWGTIVVNLSGSLIIGIVAGLLTLDLAAGVTGLAPSSLVAASSTYAPILGFVSGYTTFSTASYQTVRLAQSGRWGAAAMVGLGQLAVAAALVAVGWAAVWALTPAL